MKRRMIVLCLVIAVCATVSQANMLLNAGFETAGPDSMWGEVFESWNATTSVNTYGHWLQDGTVVNEGAMSALLNDDKWPNPKGTLTQTVAVTEGSSYAASLMVNGPGSYTTELAIDWLDDGGAVISTDSTNAAGTGDWASLNLSSIVAPAGAVNATYRVYITHGGNVKNMVYVDAAAFDVVPEPATMALLGIGSLLLRRRK